jgi:cytochrome c biogenesis protein CcdA
MKQQPTLSKLTAQRILAFIAGFTTVFLMAGVYSGSLGAMILATFLVGSGSFVALLFLITKAVGE